MTWVKLALLLLSVTESIVNLIRNKGLMDAGADREIAKASVAILQKTNTAKAVMAEVTGMSNDQVDKALKELEP